MAKGGRRQHAGGQRKPTEMKVVQGTFRADRHAAEVRVPSGWPKTPAHLNPRERALWKGLKRHCRAWVAPSDWLALNGVVSLADRLLRNQDAQRASATAGHPLVKLSVKNPVATENPLISQELKLWRELRGYIAIVGLSPVDRARVQTSSAGDARANPLDRFLNRRG
jgi:hypothetical protein